MAYHRDAFITVRAKLLQSLTGAHQLFKHVYVTIGVASI